MGEGKHFSRNPALLLSEDNTGSDMVGRNCLFLVCSFPRVTSVECPTLTLFPLLLPTPSIEVRHRGGGGSSPMPSLLPTPANLSRMDSFGSTGSILAGSLQSAS